jgi:polysaccharide biosynthesis protein PslH
MNILALYPYIPYPLDRGTYHRAYHLLRELAREHEVDLLALAENGEGLEHRHVFETFCRRVECVPFQHPPWQKLFPKRLLNPLPAHVAHWTIPEAAARLGEMLASRRYDAAHVCDLVLTQFFMREHRDIPLFLDRSRVDLQFQLMEHRRMNFPLRTRLVRCEGYAKGWFYERAAARRAACELVCGPDDEAFVRRYISRKTPVAVIGNGVDPAYFCPGACDEPPAHHPTLLFCGAMDYNPNVDALRWYFAEIHESLHRVVPELRLLVVGKNPPPEVRAHSRRLNVTVTGGVPDVRPYYHRAWAQIVPLRIGGGTRLKILESMAIGTPVVSTRIGAQGLGLSHGRDVLFADTAEEFLRQTVRLLGDAGLRHHLQKNGIEKVCAQFSWAALGAQLRETYRRVLGKEGR